MKFTNVLVLVVMLSVAVPTLAQDIVWPKLELGVQYSYLRLAPTTRYTQHHNLQGGGGSLTYNWNEFLGLTGEVLAYTSNTNAFTIPPNTIFPLGATGTAQGLALTYIFGPQMKGRSSHRLQPFAHLLFGGAYTNIYDVNLKGLCSPPQGGSCSVKAPTGNTFALDFGGGLDIPLNKSISFRPVEIDYMLTRFSNGLTGSGNQNNFHYSAGLVFTLARGTY